MHTLQTAWREPAFILGAVAIAAIILYNRAFINPANFEGYWESTFANASIFLIFTCPVGSASAAIVAARAKRAGIWALPLVRSRVAVTLRLLLPSFVAAVVAQLFGLYVLATATWGAPGRIPVEIALAWVAILVFHISLGYLLGRFLPVAASIPLAIFLSYCWLGFTWTVDYFPIRYLSGLIISSCCSVETSLDERAVICVVVFSVLMSTAFLLFATVPPSGAHWSRVPLTAGAAVACVVVAATVGLNVAQGLPAQPVKPRATADLICTGKAPTICVYPEQLQRSDPRPTLETAYKNLHEEGVSLPTKITSSNTPQDRSALRVVVPTRVSANQLIYTISAAMLPDDIAPYCGDGSDYSERLDVAAVAMWWLQKTAGRGVIDESSIGGGSLSENSDQLIHRFSQLTPQQQRDWYIAGAPTLLNCASKPIEIPSR